MIDFNTTNPSLSTEGYFRYHIFNIVEYLSVVDNGWRKKRKSVTSCVHVYNINWSFNQAFWFWSVENLYDLSQPILRLCSKCVFFNQKVVVGCEEWIQAAITTLVLEADAASRLFFIRASLVLHSGCNCSPSPQINWIDWGTEVFSLTKHKRRAAYERQDHQRWGYSTVERFDKKLNKDKRKEQRNNHILIWGGSSSVSIFFRSAFAPSALRPCECRICRWYEGSSHSLDF